MISSLELARICGVSQGTVDRALHNRKGVSEKTRQRILAAAAEHGYQANPAAREIMTGQSKIVGALIPQMNSVFFMDLFNAVKEKLQTIGIRMLLAPVSGEDETLEVLQDFVARRYRVSILVPSRDFVLPEAMTKTNTIVSLINPDKAGASTFIAPDEQELGHAATQFLIDKGHRRITHLAYSRDSYAGNARALGYIEAMEKAGLDPVVQILPDEETILKHVQRGQTAFFCHNDWLALQTLQILERNRISVPRRVAVLGVDNSPTFNSLCEQLSTVQYPYDWVADQVLALVQGEAVSPCPPPAIIERRTT